MAEATVGNLKVQIDLDSTGLVAGLNTAKANLSAMGTETTRQIQIMKANFGTAVANLDETADATDKLQLKADMLGQKLDQQKKYVAALNEAYQASVAALGEGANATQRLAVRLAQAQEAEAKTGAQIRMTNQELAGTAAASAEASAAMEETTAKTGEFEFSLEGLKSAAMGVGAVLIGGFGLFELTDHAIDTEREVYDLSKKLNITGDEAERLNMAITATGATSQEAVTALMQLDRMVQSAGKGGNVTTKALEKFNVTLTDSKGNLLPVQEQLAALSEGYKNAGDNAEAFVAGVLGSRGSQLAPLLADYEEASKAAGSVKLAGVDPAQMQKEYEQMQVMKMQFEQLGISLANSLEPVIEKMVPAIQAMSAGFQSVAQHANVLMPAIVALGAALTAYWVKTTGIEIATKAWTAAQEALNAVMDANVFALVVIGVAALAAGAYELITHWSQVKSFFENLWAHIKQIFTEATTAVLQFLKKWGTLLLAALGGPIGLIVYAVTKNWDAIKKKTTEIWNDVKDFVVNAFSWMYSHNYFIKELVDFIRVTWQRAQQDAIAIWTAIQKFFTSTWGAVVATANAIWAPISSFFSGLWGDVKTGVETAWDAIRNAIFTRVTAAVADVKEPFDSLVSYFENLAQQAYNWGANIIHQIAQGILSAVHEVVSAAESAAHAVSSFLGFHSPTEQGPGADADTWAPNLIKMYAQGIKDNLPLLHASLGLMASGLSPAGMGPAIAGMGGGASNVYGGSTYTIIVNGNNPQQVMDYIDRQLNRRGVKKV